MTVMKTALVAMTMTLIAAPALAQSRCKVMDPTGTPLNIRSAPNGAVVGQAANGAIVTILDRSRDSRGRGWVFVADRATGQSLGWVYREFIACY